MLAKNQFLYTMRQNYNWQNEAKEIFFREKKLAVEVVTGAGKTHFAIDCILDLLKENKDLKILIVSPKIVILRNWQKELLNYFTIMDVGMYYGEIKDYAKILLTTNSSIVNVNLKIYDMLIVDELHNAFVPKFNDIFQNDWKYLLGLTATLNNDDESKHWKFLSYFNYNIFKLSMKEALKEKIINNFEFYNCSVEMVEEEIIEKYNEIEGSIRKIILIAGSFAKCMNDAKYKSVFRSLLDKRNKIVFGYHRKFESLMNILLENKGKRIIIFNQYNEISRNIYLHCLDNDLSSRVVNSDVDRKLVEKYIKEFEQNKFNIMITSKMFDEGYNLPELDVAIIFSGDSTKRQSIQRIGRVLRKKDTPSKIYQIFVAKTFEENYASKRFELMKENCVASFMEVI